MQSSVTRVFQDEASFERMSKDGKRDSSTRMVINDRFVKNTLKACEPVCGEQHMNKSFRRPLHLVLRESNKHRCPTAPCCPTNSAVLCVCRPTPMTHLESAQLQFVGR